MPPKTPLYNRSYAELDLAEEPVDERRLRASAGLWLDSSWSRSVRFAKDNPWLYSASIWFPAGFLLLLFKLVKFELITRPSSTVVETLSLLASLYEYALIPALLAFAAFLIGLSVQDRFGYKGHLLLPVGLAAFVVLSVIVRLVLMSPPAWISLDFFLVIQEDIALLAAAVCATALLIAFASGIVRRVVLILASLSAVVALWIGGFDFGYFIRTGSVADGYMLKYALTHVVDLRHAVGSELGIGAWTLLVVPLLAAAIPILVANTDNHRRRVHRASYSWRMKRGLLLSGLTILSGFFFARLPVSDRAGMIRTALPAELLVEAVRSAVSVGEADAAPPAIHWPENGVALSRTDSTRTPNIVLIILESARAEMPAGVDPRDVRPYLAELATRSMDVQDASVVVPHTNKALVPILCGVYPELRQSESVNVTESCLPQLLRPLGYRSAFFTPALLDFENKGDLLASMGFDEVHGDGSFDESGFEKTNYFGFEDRIMLRPALEWMQRETKKGGPFLATLLTLTAHHDYRLPSTHKYITFSERSDLNRYLNAQWYQDRFVRDLIANMEESGEADNTVFVILGDHGEAFSEHGLQFHSAVTYQEVAHVPWLVYAPGLVEPNRVLGLRQHVDLVPTIADVLHADLPTNQLPGTSLLDDVDPRRELFMSAWIENQSMAYRVGDTKFNFHFGRRPMEVFDLENDPTEMHDVASRYPSDSLRAVERRLLAWRRGVNDRYRMKQ